MLSKAPYDALRAVVLTEMIRLREIEHGTLDDREVIDAARSQETFTQKVIERARLLSEETGDAERFKRLMSALRWVTFGLMIFGAFSGLGFVTTALGGQGTVQVPIALFALVGLNVIMLVVWSMLFVSAFRGEEVRSRGIARILWTPFMKGVLSHDKTRVVRAFFNVLQQRRADLVFFSYLSHLFWSSVAIGGLIVCAALFALRAHAFVWETTILSEATIQHLIAFFGWLPGLFGVAAPAWSEGMFIGSIRETGHWLLWVILLYAVVPRLVLVALFSSVYRLQLRRLGIDVSAPGLSSLRPRLEPASHQVIDPAPSSIVHASGRPHKQWFHPTIIASLDHEPERAAIQTDDRYWGIIESAIERDALLETLKNVPNPAILVRVDSRLSPDRGSLRTLSQIAQVCPLQVTLTFPVNEERITAWREALKESQISIQEIPDDI